MSKVARIRAHKNPPDAALDYLTFTVGQQAFAIRAVQVRDVLRRQILAPIPRTPPQVAGLMNLRGHIVTALNMHTILGTGSVAEGESMSIVVDNGGEPFCLTVDRVGDVVTIAASDVEPNPTSMAPQLTVFARGVAKTEHRLLILLDLGALFAAAPSWIAAA